MKVFVYFNLHKRVFSVKALEGANKGRVIGHREEVFLHNVQFKVSQAGRERVLREKKKNVHAGVVGYLDRSRIINDYDMNITYNPYKYSSFVKRADETPVTAANHVRLTVDETPAGRFGKIRAIHAW
jgi:hypothetical protein